MLKKYNILYNIVIYHNYTYINIHVYHSSNSLNIISLYKMTSYLELYERYINKFSEFHDIISGKIKESVQSSTEYNNYINKYDKEYNKYKQVVKEYNKTFRSKHQASDVQIEELRTKLYELNAVIIRCKRNKQSTFYMVNCDM